MGCSRTYYLTGYRDYRSNNTNKWDAQEPFPDTIPIYPDQIIPINGMLKNGESFNTSSLADQIIPINGMLKNSYG